MAEDKGEYQGNIYMHIFVKEGHRGIEDIVVKVIDKTNVKEPTQREGFLTYKLSPTRANGILVLLYRYFCVVKQLPDFLLIHFNKTFSHFIIFFTTNN